MKATLAAIALVLALVSPAPAGTGLQPLDLRVDGGEETWHVERSFTLHWTNPAGQITAIHYRLLAPGGQVAIAETTLGWPATSIENLRVPDAPGAYTAEIWLEDAHGDEGPPVVAILRFDDDAPGQVDPVTPAGWIGRNGFPYSLHLTHPAGPEPLAGIRGYAVSIDGDDRSVPCAARYTCAEPEIDLHDGVDGDSLPIADLPEGVNYVRAVAVSGSSMHSVLAGSGILRVDKTDPMARLSGLPAGWSNQPLRLTATATDAASGMTDAGSFTAIRVDGDPAAIAAGDAVSTAVIGSGTHTIAYYARDAAGNVGDGGVANHGPALAVARIDRESPRLSFAAAQDPREPERIEARAADSLSGLDRSRSSVAVRLAGSGERFAELPAELSDGLLSARWDSEAYPPGVYEFRATVYDVAGNPSSTLSRSNGAPMRLSNPLKIATTLSTDLEPAGRALPYGRGASFSGRLIAGRRAPLAGRQVQVIERFSQGARPAQRVTTVRTAANGTFDLRLRPGPNREVVARVAPTPTLRSTESEPLTLAVRSGVRLRASSPVARIGGRPVVFRGSVATIGAAIPPEGKSVQLQFRLPGIPWREFRTIRTDAAGGLRYAYRFADDDSRGVRFQFRACAPRQGGWPFEPSCSRPLSVRGS